MAVYSKYLKDIKKQTEPTISAANPVAKTTGATSAGSYGGGSNSIGLTGTNNTGTINSQYAKTKSTPQTTGLQYTSQSPVAAVTPQNVNKSGVDPSMQVGVPAQTYRVQDNGKAPVGLSAGDKVVTGGGTYQITGVNSDGTYQSTLSDANQKTRNFSGSYGQTITRPDGVVQKAFDYKYDPTDYGQKMLDSGSSAEFGHYAQQRVNQALAQERDISGSGDERSNTDLYNEWWNGYGKYKPSEFIRNGTVQQGYYGMDSDGHWGYYLDPELTQKHPDGNWDLYKASDGGQALFTTDRGYLWPANVKNESRAGQTVILAADSKAFEVKYNDQGYVESVVNLNARGVDGRNLDLPTAKSSDDRGVGGQELLRQASGVDYVGPGGATYDQVNAATPSDWAAIMENRGTYNTAGTTGTESYNTAGAGGTATAGTGTATAGTGGTMGGTGTAPTGGTSGDYAGTPLTDELKALYNGNDSAYMQALADLRAANDAAVQQTANTLEGQKRDANQSYADLFRQLYIDRMNNQRDIEQRMAMQGVTGGAAESTLLGLGTQYEDALRQGEQARLNTVYDLDQAIANARLTGDISTAEAAAQLARENVNNYADVLRNLIAQQNADRAYNYQLARDAVSDSRYAQEWAAQQAATAYQQQLAQQQLAYSQQQDAYNQQLALAKLAAQYGDYSALNGLGVDTASYAAALAAQQAKPSLTSSQVLSAIKAGNLTPAVLEAYEYYYGVPYAG